MILRVLREGLYNGLKKIKPAVSSGSLLPVLENAYFGTRDGYLILAATDLEVAIEAQVSAKVEEEGAITLPAKTMLALAKQLPEGVVRLEYDEEDRSMRVDTERANSNVKGIEAEEFPRLTWPDREPDAVLRGVDLRAAIARTSYAAATDDARPTLSGINVEPAGDGLELAATDGFRLSTAVMEGGSGLLEALDPIIESEEGETVRMNVIVPARIMDMVAKLTSEDDHVLVHLGEDGGRIYFRTEDGTRVAAQTINGNYPDFSAVTPRQPTTTITVNREHLEQATKTAQIFNAGGGSEYNIVELVTKDDTLVVSSKRGEYGQHVEEIDARIEGGLEKELSVNAAYLLDALSPVTEGEAMIGVTAVDEPIVVWGNGSKEEYLSIIMPMAFGR